MLPHSYGDLFSYLISRGHLASNLSICHILDFVSPLAFSSFLPNFFASFAKIAIFSVISKIATLQEVTFGIQFESSAMWQFSPFSPSKFAIIPKIATLQGSTFGIQFDFSPFLVAACYKCVHMLTVIGHNTINVPKMGKMFKVFIVWQ